MHLLRLPCTQKEKTPCSETGLRRIMVTNFLKNDAKTLARRISFYFKSFLLTQTGLGKMNI